MASVPPALSRKARKQNFSVSKIAILTDKAEENLSAFQSKLTNSVTNQKKKIIIIISGKKLPRR